jgi:SAM-dependent methyltransferase
MRRVAWQLRQADRYPSDTPYVKTFTRELAPAWLDHVALIQGWAPPERRSDFNWCDLGCGQGVSTAILGATHLNGDFYGIDRIADHIAEARWLAIEAGIENAHFHKADFAAAIRLDLPQFDYIVAHGVYSWIDPAARDSLCRFIDRRLKPGGLVYISYNALPGRAADLPLQRLLHGLGAHAFGNSQLRVAAAAKHLDTLLALKVPALVMSPMAKARKKHPERFPLAYLAHEFMVPHWAPLIVTEVRAAMARIGLTPVGSATLLENYDRFVLGVAARKVLAAFAEPDARELVRDFLIDQFFRRDVFVRHGRRLGEHARRLRLYSSSFSLARPLSEIRYHIATPAGLLRFDKPVAREVVTALAGRPRSLAEIASLCEAGDVLASTLALCAAGMIWPVERGRTNTTVVERAILRRLGGAGEILWLPLPCGTAIAAPRALLQFRRHGRKIKGRKLVGWRAFLVAQGI